MKKKFEICQMSMEHVIQAYQLLKQHAYPIGSLDFFVKQAETIISSNEHVMYVLVMENEVKGLIHASLEVSLMTPKIFVVHLLQVDEAFIGKGFERLLLAALEKIAKQQDMWGIHYYATTPLDKDLAKRLGYHYFGKEYVYMKSLK